MMNGFFYSDMGTDLKKGLVVNYVWTRHKTYEKEMEKEKED